jgi:hypothetical protein
MSANMALATDLRRHPEIADRGSKIGLHIASATADEAKRRRCAVQEAETAKRQLSTASATDSGDVWRGSKVNSRRVQA